MQKMNKLFLLLLLTYSFLRPQISLSNEPNKRKCNISASEGKKLLQDSFGPEFLYSEQEAQGKMPIFHHPSHMASFLFPNMKFSGSLPEEYVPQTAKAFEVPSFLIPETELNTKVISANFGQNEKLFHIEKDGETYYRYFIHPLEVNAIRRISKQYQRDSTTWVAMPSSSPRSLFVAKKGRPEDSFFAKTSILQDIGLFHRSIGKYKLIRAVKVNDILTELKSKTQGKLKQSNKFWSFFNESLGIIPNQSLAHGLIYRSTPKDLQENKDVFLVPWMSIIAADRGERLIDKLYRKSHYNDKLEFTWNELAKPVLELHNLITLDSGLSTEMHQQNMLLAINKKSLKIEGLVLRDMDGMWVNYILRKKVLNQEIDEEALSIGKILALHHDKVGENMHFSYLSKIRLESFRWILKYFLSKRDLKILLKMSDKYVLEAFNETFPNYHAENFSELEQSWKSLQKDNTSPEEQKLFDQALKIRSNSNKKNSESIVKKLTEYYIRWIW